MRKLAMVIMMSSVLCMLGCGASRQPVSPEDSATQTPNTAVSAPEAAETGSEQTEATSNTEASQTTEEAQSEAIKEGTTTDIKPEDSTVKAPAEGTEQRQDADAFADIPADFFRCEVRISLISSIYDAQAIGPTLEEARDNAVDEACAVPCAEQIADKNMSEDESEEALDKCTEACVVDSKVLAGICWQNQVSVYTEGDWDENGDPAPTNGDETFEIKQGQ